MIHFTHYTFNIKGNKISLTSSNKLHRIVEALSFTNKCYGKES